jgi:hypothetical protein
MALTDQNIESELSYAYLHAVAGMAGMSCKVGDRHDDGAGVDAEVTYRGPTLHRFLTHVQLNIQIKATIKGGGTDPNYLSYFLAGTDRYDKLRTKDSLIYKILVVLFLPTDAKDWLTCSPKELIMKDAAYWACLYGAAASGNKSGETVYLSRTNLLTPQSLRDLAMAAVQKKVPNYVAP